MRQASILLVVVGCTEGGSGGPPPGEIPPIDTGQFIVQFCVSGLPGEPTCPRNTLPLDTSGAAGSTMSFVAQALGSGVYFNEVTFVAGDQGLYLEHPVFLMWPTGATEPNPAGDFEGLILNLAPGTSSSLDEAVAAVNLQASDKMSVGFDVLGPFRP